MILNQIAETRRVRDIAKMVSEQTGVDLSYITNPRQESAENELDVQNQKFKDLGLDPILLNEKLFEEVQEVTKKYKDRCIKEKVLPKSFWNKKRAQANETGNVESKEPVTK